MYPPAIEQHRDVLIVVIGAAVLGAYGLYVDPVRLQSNNDVTASPGIITERRGALDGIRGNWVFREFIRAKGSSDTRHRFQRIDHFLERCGLRSQVIVISRKQPEVALNHRGYVFAAAPSPVENLFHAADGSFFGEAPTAEALRRSFCRNWSDTVVRAEGDHVITGADCLI